MDCRNILQSSVVPEVYNGVGGQKSIDTMMMMMMVMILSKKTKSCLTSLFPGANTVSLVVNNFIVF
jgi:hypothetical protein